MQSRECKTRRQTGCGRRMLRCPASASSTKRSPARCPATFYRQPQTASSRASFSRLCAASVPELRTCNCSAIPHLAVAPRRLCPPPRPSDTPLSLSSPILTAANRRRCRGQQAVVFEQPPAPEIGELQERFPFSLSRRTLLGGRSQDVILASAQRPVKNLAGGRL